MEIEPEVALGRRVHDLIKNLKNDPETLVNLLDHFLLDYLYHGVKDMYKETGRKVKASSDFIINAHASTDAIIEQISKLVTRKQRS